MDRPRTNAITPGGRVARHTKHVPALDGVPTGVELSLHSPEQSAISNEELARIHGILSREISADLSYYRPELVRRQILRRMALRPIGEAAEYIQFLRDDAQERQELFRDLLARPTGFFQEAAVLDALGNGTFGMLWKEQRPSELFRVWVPCCSSGEEAYSVAITAIEMLDRFGPRTGIQVFGTDLNERALERARTGVYGDSALSGIAGERLSRFFNPEAGQWRVSRQLREVCLFAHHHLAGDPPLSKMDLVVLRNQLPAMTAAMQTRILGVLHYSLKAGGVLALGHAERVDAAPELFTAAPGRPGIYMRKETGHRFWYRRAAAEIKPTYPARDGGTAVMQQNTALRTSDLHPVTSSEERTAKAHHHIQALLEEQTHTIEALKVANEEITASNEELMVTIEELTATREELQAANQELITINQEMDARNLTLARTSSELSALWRNIHLAIVRVDSNLRIRRFTPQAERLFSIAESDVGRPFTDLKPKLEIPELELLLKETVSDLSSHERETRSADGSLYRLSIRPYRGEDERIDGAIVTVWPLSTN